MFLLILGSTKLTSSVKFSVCILKYSKYSLIVCKKLSSNKSPAISNCSYIWMYPKLLFSFGTYSICHQSCPSHLMTCWLNWQENCLSKQYCTTECFGYWHLILCCQLKNKKLFLLYSNYQISFILFIVLFNRLPGVAETLKSHHSLLRINRMSSWKLLVHLVKKFVWKFKLPMQLEHLKVSHWIQLCWKKVRFYFFWKC